MKKRLLSLALALSMMVSMFPTALATDSSPAPDPDPDPSITITGSTEMYYDREYTLTAKANDLPSGANITGWEWVSSRADVLPNFTGATADTDTYTGTPQTVSYLGISMNMVITLTYEVDEDDGAGNITTVSKTIERTVSLTVSKAPDMSLEISGVTELTFNTDTPLTAVVANEPVGYRFQAISYEWTSENDSIAPIITGNTESFLGTVTAWGGLINEDVEFTLEVDYTLTDIDTEAVTHGTLQAVHVITILKNDTPPDVLLALSSNSLEIVTSGNTETTTLTMTLSGSNYDKYSTEYKIELTNMYIAMLEWEVDKSDIAFKFNTTTTASPTSTLPNVAKVALQVKGDSPGQTDAFAYIDLNQNKEWDEGEPRTTFMITLNGIVLQFANQTISKYTESDDLLAYAYGNLGNLDWSAINPAVASIEVTDGNFDEDLNMTISTGVVTGVNTGTTEITVSNSQYSVSFYTTVEETTAPDIHPEAEVNSVNPLYFSTLIDDFKFSSNEIFEDETLISLSSLSVPPAMGTLYYGYQNPDNMGAGVATERSYYITGEPNVKDIVFVPNTSYTGSEISISYTGTTDSNRLFSGKIILSLSAIEDVEITTAAETPVNLVATQFAQVSTSKIGQTLSHITLHLPAETRGTFYYQYVNEENYHHKIALGEEIAAANISNVTFIPAAGYTGALPVSYTGVTVSNLTYSGTMTIHVGAYGADGPVVYNTRVNEYVTFTTTSFESNVEALTGNRLSHVVFTPPSASEGVLYEDYISSYNYLRQVNETITYYSTSRSPYISSISFVPATDFTGTCSIPFVGYDIEGNSYQGTVQINVANFVEGDINYYATSGGYVRFNDDDFNSLSTTLAESNIDYIYFDSLPSTSTGTIRYGQTSSSSGSLASTGTHYYRNSSSYIDDLTFEANAWFTGVAEIPFHGVGTNGKTFSGIVSVVVTNQSVARISYTATFNQPAQLSLEDFNHISMERTGTSLDYVRFALPYSSQASLYYNYTNANQNEGLVTAGRSYYATSSPLVDNISIVPYPSYSGVCEISFVGWGTNGKEFYGTISVTIGTASQPLGYEVHHGDYITLDSSDINAYVLSEINSPLDYITISLPTTSQGTLYQTYTETATYNPKASASTKYYRSSTPYINNLTFVPNPDFYGTVSLDFTAKTTDGSTSKGTIYIEVLPMQAEGTIYYSTTINAIEFDTEDFDAVWSGDDIAYVVFDNIPVTTQGKLYYANSLSALAAAGERYYMDPALTPNFGEMIFAPMAGYYDPIRLSYTATTSNGGRFVGEIQINIERTTVSSSFNDMSEYTWAIAAAEYLKLADVTSGVAIGSYGPSSRITRGDYALMLVKAFHLSTTTPTTAFNDVDSSKYYAAAIYTLRALGIVTGNNNSYSPDSYISRQDAMLMLYQAMTVAGKNLPIGSTAYLIPYNDDQDISDYAVNALGTMVRATLITGDNNNNLNPQNNMSRAEMAVVLHKAMTI